MLHGNSTFSTYHSFFAHIAAVLRGSNKTRLVLGSDEETALVQSMKSCFSEATLVTCTRHLRNNFEDYLRNKVGLPSHDRYRLSTMVFGEKGVVAAEDSHEYEAKVACLHRAVQDLPIGDGKNMLVRYLNNKFLPVVLDRVVVPNQRLGLGTKWTTNNCESINHVLKQVVNWKPQPRPQLVEKLRLKWRSNIKISNVLSLAVAILCLPQVSGILRAVSKSGMLLPKFNRRPCLTSP